MDRLKLLQDTVKGLDRALRSRANMLIHMDPIWISSAIQDVNRIMDARDKAVREWCGRTDKYLYDLEALIDEEEDDDE